MFKVVSAELKKFVSKPGIYVLSVLLAIVLVLGIFIYKPTVHKSNAIELNGPNVLQKYSYFNGTVKPTVMDDISKSIDIVKFYKVEDNNGPISHKENISNKLATFENNLQTYLSYAYDESVITDSYINTYARPQLIDSLKDLNSAVDTAINRAKQGSYAVITTEQNYNTYTIYYSQTLALLSTNASKDKIADIVHDYETKYKSNFVGSIKALKYPTLADSTIETFTTNETGTKLNTIYARLNSVEQKIAEMKHFAESGEKDNADYYYNYDPEMCNKIDQLATEYVAISNTYTNLLKYHLITTAFDVVSTNDQLNLLYLKTESEYNANSLLIRYNYLFENNKTENAFARPLTIGVSSNNAINAYDYAYFILRVFSFIIIVYAVMTACQTIAGEIRDGSMRYFAIRPISRGNIFFGKMFAILLMSVIMIIFSSLIALCVGGGVYGFNSLDILTIFNGSNAIVINPIVMLGIYLLSFICELFVYLAIAMFLSCLIKSDLFAVTIMLVIYLINALLPMFVGGANTWLAFYPFSHISLYSLFGSTIYASSSNFFNLIFGMKTYAGTNLGLTLFSIITFILLFIVLAINKFKKKEL